MSSIVLKRWFENINNGFSHKKLLAAYIQISKRSSKHLTLLIYESPRARAKANLFYKCNQLMLLKTIHSLPNTFLGLKHQNVPRSVTLRN
jgi:hypothetical protein